MKINIFFCSLLLSVLMSCNSSQKKSENIIDEALMEDVLYDITLMSAIKRLSHIAPKSRPFYNENYILKKYGITKAQLDESRLYYSENPKKLSKMYEQVAKRIERQKDSINKLSSEKKNESIKSKLQTK